MQRLTFPSIRRTVAALAVAVACGQAGLAQAQAQVAPSVSLADQMRGMLNPNGGGAGGAAAAGGSGGAAAPAFAPAPAVPAGARGLGTADAPLVAAGPGTVKQSAAELAQRFPTAQRAAMGKAYEESFVFWQKLEAQLGLTPDDVAAGVAAFIAGNYAAYTQQQVADDDFKTLVGQMQRLLAQNGGFMQSTPATKRAMFEQLAMVGTFMAVYREHLLQKPNPNETVNFRNAAKANLEAALGLSADRMQIGRQGLVTR